MTSNTYGEVDPSLENWDRIYVTSSQTLDCCTTQARHYHSKSFFILLRVLVVYHWNTITNENLFDF
jgi:hypothetical protein